MQSVAKEGGKFIPLIGLSGTHENLICRVETVPIRNCVTEAGMWIRQDGQRCNRFEHWFCEYMGAWMAHGLSPSKVLLIWCCVGSSGDAYDEEKGLMGKLHGAAVVISIQAIETVLFVRLSFKWRRRCLLIRERDTRLQSSPRKKLLVLICTSRDSKQQKREQCREKCMVNTVSVSQERLMLFR
jgi:hypothetical protein